MDTAEYERRRRAIEEQLRADLELIRAGSQAKLRALEALWLASPAADTEHDGSETLASAGTPNETLASPPIQNETLASAETEIASTRPMPDATPAPASVAATRRADVLAEILAAFSDLPAVFDKADVVRLLGYEPRRQTLNRVWSQLIQEGKIAIETPSDGRRPTRFRKLAPD